MRGPGTASLKEVQRAVLCVRGDSAPDKRAGPDAQRPRGRGSQAGGGRGRGGWRLGVSRGTGSERTEGVSSVLKNSIKFAGVTLVNKVM